MLTYRATSGAPVESVWSLMARPERWREWAPHVRGAWGLGEPEVIAGRSGAVRLLGVVPVPVRVTGKRRGRGWTWRVGPVDIAHRAEALPSGSVATIEISAPWALERMIAVSYGPLVRLLVRNLARVAESHPG